MNANLRFLRVRRRTAALWLLGALSLSAIGCGASAAKMAPESAPPPAAIASSAPSGATPAAADAAPATEMPTPGIRAPVSAPNGGATPIKTGSAPAANPSSVQAKSSPNAPKLEEAQKPLLIYEGALGIEVPKGDLPGSIERSIDIA